jgi:hemerythrin-like metal-binding protein
MIMQWNQSCSLGIPAIDEQHRELYAMLNDLSLAMENGHGKTIAARVMNRLFPFIREHFAEEERSLRQIHSPAYRQCCARHVQQLAAIQIFLAGRSAQDPSSVIDLLYFLDSLLAGHVDSDRRALGLDPQVIQ